ncbi:MAG TPA: hypothetical protein VL992_09090, partial [Tepidisphaeraceae bacterium]|nr:hypothetical protein [Tepidisphaeraceae bacterium]
TQQAKIKIVSTDRGLFHVTRTMIKIDADRTPLMEVLAEICSQAGLVPYNGYNGYPQRPVDPNAPPQLVLSQETPGQTLGPWEVSGPFAYMIGEVDHTVSAAPDAEGASLQIIIYAHAEPRLHMLVGPGNFTVTELTDDLGHSLLPNGNPYSTINQYQQMDWSSPNVDRSIFVPCPAAVGKKIVRLRATDHCLVESASQTVTLTVPTLNHPTTRPVAGMVIAASIDPQYANNSGMTAVTISYSRAALPASQWNELGPTLPGVYPTLFDATGNQSQNSGWTSSSNYNAPNYVLVQPTFMDRVLSGITGRPARAHVVFQPPQQHPDMFQRTYFFNLRDMRGNPIKPDHVMLKVPTRVAAVDVPIEFDNLPLP